MRTITSSLLAVAAALALGVSANAQSVTTDPVGFTTLTVNAKPASIRGFTYLSLDLTQLPAYKGLVTAVSSSGSPTVLTFPAHSFSTGQYDNIAYVEVTNGSNAGRISVIATTTDSASASTLTLADDISSSVTANTSTVKVTPMWTFGTAFGVNNSAGFQGGVTPSSSDVVQLFKPSTGASTLYYYNTTNSRWQTGAADATNVVIPPNVGLLIERKTTSAFSFNLAGAVKLGPTGVFIQGGSNSGNPTNINIVANPYPAASLTLANSNLYTGNLATGVLGGVTPSSSDQVIFYNSSTGASTIYYYNTTNSRWQTGASDASNVVISDGTSIVIKRQPSNGSFIWYVPQPF